MISAADLEQQIRNTLDISITEVFRTMLEIQLEKSAVPAADKNPELKEQRVVGVIGIGGSATAALYLDVPHALAGEVTKIAMGLGDNENATDHDINDTICELTNMSAGKVKSFLADSGWPCVLSLPSIVRALDVHVEEMAGAQELKSCYRFGNHFIFAYLLIPLVKLVENKP